MGHGVATPRLGIDLFDYWTSTAMKMHGGWTRAAARQPLPGTATAPATTFAHLDATNVLSRRLASKGIYHAVDPLDSTCLGLLSKNIMKLQKELNETLHCYKELPTLGHHCNSWSTKNRAVLITTVHCNKSFNGSSGKYVGFAETIIEFELILSSELDGLPE
ncbi:hypothetical protein U9M48_044375 [Paspalum notatum var. saurae]|uniref:H(+)-transporting two-sector ATPase n=1 Tax=Paspalum notatum var. saurae TaxID=547442 RepID=A0AAQ3XJI8_PASNO